MARQADALEVLEPLQQHPAAGSWAAVAGVAEVMRLDGRPHPAELTDPLAAP